MKRKKSLGFSIFKGILALIVLLIIVVSVTVVLVMCNVIDSRDSMAKENEYISQIITFEKEGESISTISNFDKKKVNYVEYKDIPKNLVNAVVSIEDKRFYGHIGIDFVRTFGAVFSFLTNDGSAEFGGSTITQQLVKIVTEDDDRTWTRKIREWVRSFEIESKLSKEQIITTYLNTIYFGNGNFGIESVSKDYFNKEISDLNLAECATLAASIQTPEGTNPFKSDENRKKLISRKNLVLAEMLDLKKITQKEYDDAIKYVVEFSK